MMFWVWQLLLPLLLIAHLSNHDGLPITCPRDESGWFVPPIHFVVVFEVVVISKLLLVVKDCLDFCGLAVVTMMLQLQWLMTPQVELD